MATKSNTRFTPAWRPAAILVSCLLAVPAFSDSPPAVTAKNLEKLTWAKATVVGTPESLKQFDENLKKVLGFSDLESHLMGCVEGCDNLNSMNPPNRIVYVFPRENPDFLKRFGKTWNETQEAAKDPGFTIKFEPAVGTPDCTGPSNPAPCQSMQFCAVDQCGRKTNNKIDCNAC